MSPWVWVVGGAALGVVVALAWRARHRSEPGSSWSPVRVTLGVLVTVLALAAGSMLVGVRTLPPPEQRGFGVAIKGLTKPSARTGEGVGVTLIAAVDLKGCGDDVQVTLSVVPTAEFWIDHWKSFEKKGATVRIAIPATRLSEVTASTEFSPFDGALSAVVPAQTAPESRAPARIVTIDEQDESQLTVVTVKVPGWGARQSRPLTLTFDADLTTSRSRLGGCYVQLPALVGPATALSAAAAAGVAQAGEDAERLPPTALVVSSRAPVLAANYRPFWEVTRGVATLELHGHSVVDAASLPGPDTSFGGDPAWTCRSSPPEVTSRQYTAVRPGQDVGDLIMANPVGPWPQSANRMALALGQRTCASYVAIEPPGFGTRRDLFLMGIGALFSLGIELLLSGTRRRRRPEREPARPPIPPV